MDMKEFVILLLSLSLSGFALAERFTDVVDSISYGKKGEDHLIFLKNGRVVFVNHKEALPKLGQKIEVELDSKNRLISILSLSEEVETHGGIDDLEEISLTEDASVLENYSQVSSVFGRMNRSWKKKTECTDRAHVWSYEEWRRSGLISKKVFLFFTKTYIRKYRFGWWFHVSPYTMVRSGESTIDYVIDRKYSSIPRTMKSWTDIFIRSKKSCPITTYRHYRSNQYSNEHCFAVKSNMYNRLPYHVRMKEDYGRELRQFYSNEVNFSYRAFYRRND
jgi:hypothetical protein